MFRERIGCAVAEIEGGGVATSAIAQKSDSRSLCKFCILGHHLDFRPGDERVGKVEIEVGEWQPGKSCVAGLRTGSRAVRRSRCGLHGFDVDDRRAARLSSPAPCGPPPCSPS